MNPAVRLIPYMQAANAVTPVAGVGGFQAVVPVDEPASVGTLPVRPDLVADLNVQLAARVVRAVSGPDVVAPVDNGDRPTFTVTWAAITKTEVQLLIAFFRGDASGRQYAFDLEPDGPGCGTISARATARIEFQQTSPSTYAALVACEQVW